MRAMLRVRQAWYWMTLIGCVSATIEECPADFARYISPRTGISRDTLQAMSLVSADIETAVDVAIRLDFAYYDNFVNLIVSVPKSIVTGSVLDTFTLTPSQGGLFSSSMKAISFIPRILHNNTDPDFASIALNRSALEKDPWLNNESKTDLYTQWRSKTFGVSHYGLQEVVDGARVERREMEEYYPVHYIYPLQGNVPAVGFDLASSAVRKNAIKTAERNFGKVVTGRIRAVQSTYEQYGFLMFYPLFNNPSDPSRFYSPQSVADLSINAFPSALVSAVYVVQDVLGKILSSTLRFSGRAGSSTLVLVFQKLGYQGLDPDAPNQWEYMAGFSDVIDSSNETLMAEFNADWKNNREQDLNIVGHKVDCATQHVDHSGSEWKLIIAVDFGCQIGEYLIEEGQPGKRLSRCGVCSPGLHCSGQASQSIPEVSNGYFAQSEGGEYLVYECRPATACPGAVLTNKQCAGNREGFLCSQCPNGWFATADGCDQCGGERVAAIVFSALIGMVLVVLFSLGSLGKTGMQNPLSLTAGLALGQLVAFLQVLASFAKTDMKWGFPMSVVLDLLGLLSLDLSVLRLACAGIRGPQVQYLLVMCIPLVAICLLVITYKVCRCLAPNLTNLAGLVNGVGQIMSLMFITLVLAVLSPFQCFAHPNGKRSLVAHPEILCGIDPAHAVMVTGACLVAVLYLGGYVCMVLYATWAYPNAIVKGHINFLARYRFLLIRWKPEAYWFSVVLAIRNFCIATVPMVVPSEHGHAIAFLLICALSLPFGAKLRYLPWRNAALNSLNLTLDAVLLMLIIAGALTLNGQEMSSSLSMLLLVAASLAVVFGAGLALSKLYQLAFRSKTFSVFISHHKASSACSARFIKLVFTRLAGSNVFLDVDNLLDLNTLFDAVRDSSVLLLLLSRETFRRPWIVGEVVCAHSSGVPMHAVALNDSFDAEQARLARLSAVEMVMLEQSKQLMPFSVGEAQVSDAVDALFGRPVLLFCVTSQAKLAESISALQLVVTSANTLQNAVRTTFSSRTFSEDQVDLVPNAEAVMIGDHADSEALAAAAAIKILLQELTQKNFVLELDGSSTTLERLMLKDSVPIVMFLISSRTFSSASQLKSLVWVLNMFQSPLIMPMLLDDASIPSQKDFETFKQAGGHVTRLQQIFHRIAIRINVSFAPDAILRASVQRLVKAMEGLSADHHSYASDASILSDSHSVVSDAVLRPQADMSAASWTSLEWLTPVESHEQCLHSSVKAGAIV